MNNNCLIELGCEELPPKALKTLSENFASLVQQALVERDLSPSAVQVFATPRRLAMLLENVPMQQPDQAIEKRGPALQAAFDAEGMPSKAALGFAQSCGTTVELLEQRETEKGAWLYFARNEPGLGLRQLLPDLVASALAKLPIAKRMRWGAHSDEFVRPVKWLVILIGADLVEANILGVASGRLSYGHRFHAPAAITLAHADDYAEQLLSQGKVLVSFEARKTSIRGQIVDSAKQLSAVANIDEDLLDEVTALVEYPVAVCGKFDADFLSVPQEALVMTMQDNQKYFALFDKKGALLPHFITLANIDSKQPEVVAAGNERVIRPRFADARFFYQQDQKQPLSARLAQLDTVVFQEQLGSIGDKARRIGLLAAEIASQLELDLAQVKRAAELCKCDLMSDMVGEFPKLQGVMGRYYASHEGEPAAVCDAIEQHYWPRYAGDELPQGAVAQSLALADRLDSLVGIFAIGQKPSGVKDPFGLRRSALGVVRILIEKDLPLDLAQLCAQAAQVLPAELNATAVVDEVVDYIFDRLKAYYQERGLRYDVVDAVIYNRPTLLRDCDRRVQALQLFQSNEAAAVLAAANKRIANILKKQVQPGARSVDSKRLELAAEKELYKRLIALQNNVATLFTEGRYDEGLNQLASLRPAVDKFFEEVMVMVDDAALQANRLALLELLLGCFRQVADFSRIQS